MNVEEFLTNGNVKPNPDYNPKTKKGKFQAPTLVDYKPENTNIDKSISNISRIAAGNLYSFSEKEYDKYAEYNTYLNTFDTQEDLNRERAENQSWIEQTGHMLGQAVVNEVILGTFLGLSNIVDAGINLKRYLTEDDYHNDFTNIVSRKIEETQDKVREELAIYRKDPNASWAITDFGWWADNMVSVASTASMLVPTIGITKTLSAVGRGIRTAANAGKGGKLIEALNAAGNAVSAEKMGIAIANKYGKKFASLSDSGKVADALRTGREIGQNALMSRTMEGYMEAREVYRQVEEDALNRIKSFTPEQKEAFYKNNEELRGKSDEEIAHEIAGESAETTFRNDYTMLLMDLVQFKALGELYTSGRKPSKASLDLETKKQKDKLLGITNNETKSLFNNDFLWKVKYNFQHPTQGLFAVEWSEGFEEGFQGVQTEKGKEVAEKYFNPNFTPRELRDYLTDPAIYEQAFWGVIGAVGFSGVTKGLDYLSKKVNKSLENYLYDTKEISLIKLTEEISRRKGIEGWADNINQFISDINNIKQGKNPYKVSYNEDGTSVMEDVKDGQMEVLIDRRINDFVTEVGLNSLDRGNFDIFKEFLTDPEISKFIQQQTNNTNDTKAYNDLLVKKLEEVSDTYNRELYNLRTTLHVQNPFVAQAVARSIVRTRLGINDVNDKINNIETQINKLNPDGHNYSNWEQSNILRAIIPSIKAQLKAREAQYLNELNNHVISKQTYDAYMEDLNRKRYALATFIKDNVIATPSEELSKLFSAVESSLDTKIDTSSLTLLFNKLDAFASQFQVSQPNIPQNIAILLNQKNNLKYLVHDAISQIPVTQTDYQREYDAQANLIDKIAKNRIMEASDNIVKWIEQQSDLNEAKRLLYENRVPELKESLDIIKLGHENTREFWSSVNFALNAEERRRAKEERERQTITVDGERVSPEDALTVREEATAEPEESPSFTGESQQTNPIPQTTPVQPTPQAQPTPIAVPDENPYVPTPPPSSNVAEPSITDSERVLAQDEWVSRKPTKDEESVAAKLDKAAREDAELKRLLKATSIVKDLYKSHPNWFQNKPADNNYDYLINPVSERLERELNIDGDTARNSAIIAIQAMFKRLELNTGDNKYIQMAHDIATNTYFSALGDIIDINSLEEQAKLIERFIEAYIDKLGRDKFKGKTKVINLFHVYQSVINDENMSVEMGIEFFRNLQTFINNKDARKLLPYKFTQITMFSKYISEPILIKQALEDARNLNEWEHKYERIAITNDEEGKKLARNLPADAVLEVEYDMNKSNSISIKYNNTEVGYLAPVTVNSDNTSFKRQLFSGINYEVTINKNGTQTTYSVQEPLEKFMRDLLRNKDNDEIELIYKLLHTEFKDITDEEYKSVINGEYFKSLYGDIVNYRHGKEKLTDYEKVNMFLHDIRNILTFDKEAATDTEKYISWETFKRKLFENFQFTHNLMTARKAEITYVNNWEGGVQYSKDETDYVDVGSAELGLNGKDNPIAIVDDNGKIRIEGQNETERNAAGFPRGTMGFVLRRSKNGSALALVKRQNPVTSNTKFNTLLNEELTDLFTKHFDKAIEFEDLSNSLHDLLVGRDKLKNTRSIFRGLAVIQDENKSFVSIGYKENGEYKYILKINRYKKDTKDAQYHIVYSPTGTKESAIIIKEDNDNLRKAINDIINRLTFNTSYLTIINNTSTNITNTKYFHTNADGKIVISLGSAKNEKALVYDNYSDFAIKENLFKTNAQKVNGSFFENNGGNVIFVNATGTTIRSTQNTDNVTTLEKIQQTDNNTPIETSVLFNAMALNEEVANFLLGENIYKIDLVPTKVHYKKSGKAEAEYNSNTKRISLHPKFFAKDGKSTTNGTKVRLLMHEYIHAKFYELDEVKQKRILNDLKLTFNAFINSLDNIDYDSLTKEEQNTIDALIKFKDKLIKRYGKDEERLMKEWLSESLSQNVLIKYLNDTYYGDTVTGEPQTILQKIIKALLQLFRINGGNIKNNSILAKQFEILGDNTTQTTDTTTDNSASNDIQTDDVQNEAPVQPPVKKQDEPSTPEDSVEDSVEDNVVEQTPTDTLSTEEFFKQIDKEGEEQYDINEEGDTIIFDEENEEYSEEEDYSLIGDIGINEDISTLDKSIDNLITNPNINPAKLTPINNMTDYLNNIDAQDRDNVRKSMEDGVISYVCY